MIEIVATLERVAGEHAELETRLDGRRCLTRVLALPVPLAWSPSVERAVIGDREPLPEAIAAALEGYRTRARLRDFAGLPTVVAAGVEAFPPEVMPPAGEGLGHAYVTREWIEGANLGDARGSLPLGERLGVAGDLLRLLARLHERGLSHGRVTPRGVVIERGQPRLVDLACLRAGEPAADLTAFGGLASWLLDPELTQNAGSPEVASWRRIIAACLAGRPGPGTTSRDLVAAIPKRVDTIPVPEPDSPRRGRRAMGLLVAALLAAAGVGALVLVARPDSPATPPAPTRGGERPFRACKLGGEPRAVIATIHAREPVPHLPTIASWFPPDVPPHEIEIRGVTSGDKRTITFELGGSSWSAWRAVVGDATGEEICWRLAVWLRKRGAGREENARPDIIGDRGPETREEALGTVAGLSVPGAHRRLESWLNPSRLRASCEVERSRFDLVARCTVESVSDSELAIELAATLEVDDQPPFDQTRDDVVVGAGESVAVPFHFDVPEAFEAASCRCQARAR